MLQRLCFILMWIPCRVLAEVTAPTAQGANPPPSPATLFGGLSSWFFSTVGIVALIFVLGMLLKKSKLAINRRSGDLYLENQIALGPKERLMIINVRGRSIVVGVTAQNINYICEAQDLQTRTDFATELARSSNLLHKQGSEPLRENKSPAESETHE